MAHQTSVDDIGPLHSHLRLVTAVRDPVTQAGIPARVAGAKFMCKSLPEEEELSGGTPGTATLNGLKHGINVGNTALNPFQLTLPPVTDLIAAGFKVGDAIDFVIGKEEGTGDVIVQSTGGYNVRRPNSGAVTGTTDAAIFKQCRIYITTPTTATFTHF